MGGGAGGPGLEFGESDVGGGGADGVDGESDFGGGAGGEGDGGLGAVVVEWSDVDGGSVGEQECAGGDVVGEVGSIVEVDAVDGLRGCPVGFYPAAVAASEGGPFFGVVAGVAVGGSVDGFGGGLECVWVF